MRQEVIAGAGLQLVQNAAARLAEHLTSIPLSLPSLHRLPIKFRIQCKVLVGTHRALHGQAPVLYI